MSEETMRRKVQANVKREGHAVFSTDVLVNHSATEFRITFFDTWMSRPTEDGGIAQNKDVVAEVVVTPPHFKALCKAMTDNLKKYESMFGEIKMPIPDQKPRHEKGGTESLAYM